MKVKLYSLLVAGFLLSCSAKTENKTMESFPVESEKTIEKPTENVLAQTDATSEYLRLKNLLVKSDAALAAQTAINLSAALTAQGMSTEMIDAANEIAASSDLAAQRKSFKIITDKLIEYLKTNGTNQTVYVQYCPMAFNNTGASWLSDSKEVLNPYFGDRMLRCGSVKEEIKN